LDTLDNGNTEQSMAPQYSQTTRDRSCYPGVKDTTEPHGLNPLEPGRVRKDVKYRKG
jgi:hypothetical protein